MGFPSCEHGVALGYDCHNCNAGRNAEHIRLTIAAQLMAAEIAAGEATNDHGDEAYLAFRRAEALLAEWERRKGRE